jgi:hypothetical protein
MVYASYETEIYRRDAKHKHNLLTPAEREKLLEVCSCAEGATFLQVNTDELDLAIFANTALKITYTSIKISTTDRVRWETETPVEARCSTVPQEPDPCSGLYYHTYRLLNLHTDTTSISCSD